VLEPNPTSVPTTSIVDSNNKTFSNQLYPDNAYYSFSMEQYKLETKRIFREINKVHHFRQFGELRILREHW
jgi:hypothetical protein